MARVAPVSVVIATFAVCTFYFAVTAPLPYFSESWTHLDAAAHYGTVARCFSPDLVPLRPLQHLLFFALERSDAGPVVGRALMVVSHGVSMWLVFSLTFNLTLSRSAAWVAWVLFAVAPVGKTLVWCAAVGWPGLTVCLLGAVWCYSRLLENGGRTWSGWCGLGLALLGLGFHQAGVLVPVLVVVSVVGRERAAGLGWVGRKDQLLKLIRTPPFVALVAAVATYTVYVAVLRENRYHGINHPSAVPASAVRALFALYPEVFRGWALEGLRGGRVIGLVLGVFAVLLATAGIVFLLWTASVQSRIWFLMGAVICALPVMTSGFWHRYVYAVAPFVAVALALWWQRDGGSRWRTITLGVVALSWGVDAVIDVAECAAAGRLARRLVAEASAEAQAMSAENVGGVAGRERLIVVDPPAFFGWESDSYLFTFGFASALRREGALLVDVDVVTTERMWSSTDMRRVDEDDVSAMLDHAAQRPHETVLRYDPSARTLVAR